MCPRGSCFGDLFVKFRSLFTAPSFSNFVCLSVGWILCSGRHTVSRVIQFCTAMGGSKHHSTWYRFLSRAGWAADELGRVVFGLALRFVSSRDVYVVVDDTLCRKTGPQLWGGGMHHDAVSSNYGRGSRRVVSMAFGHNWVIASVWVPLPWAPERGLAIPVGFRLYRAKRRCPPDLYRKRSELALELLLMAADWLPAGRRLVAVGDSEYSCRTVIQGLPDDVVFVGRMPMDAAVFDRPGKYAGTGRPPKKGPRLPSPEQLAASRVWRTCTPLLYGRPVDLEIQGQTCLWYHTSGQRAVRMIVTRDPRRRIEDRAYMSTDPNMSDEDIACIFSVRWSEEVLHRNVKQFLGLSDPQNGWWRRRAGRHRDHRVQGSQPERDCAAQATLRTVPFVLGSYAIVVLWYFGKGSPDRQVRSARRRAPWYRHKTDPSFGDMLAAARSQLATNPVFVEPGSTPHSTKTQRALLDLMLAA